MYEEYLTFPHFVPYFAKKRPAAHRIAREAAGPLHIFRPVVR